ncbi:MAG: hypothetical protein WA421_00255 [Nitrososphaeraceae archaeon]
MNFVENGDYLQRINRLTNKISAIEREIAYEVDIVKEYYIKASSFMIEPQIYFLNGIQAGPSAKSYLLTSKGIEVLGEETIPVAEFIDNVFNFANNPKTKIEVLMNFATHLHKINQMITDTYPLDEKEKTRLSAEKMKM